MKKISLLFLTFLLSCGTQLNYNLSYIEPPATSNKKTTPPEEKILNKWAHLDLQKDTIPGMSVELAYEKLINGKASTTVIVGVIDSGIDIEHEDLKDVIWVNDKEIPNNNIDDDKNGYVDDINGWNFLGDAVRENLEYTRIVKKGDDGSQMYKDAKKKYAKEVVETRDKLKYYTFLMNQFVVSDSIIRTHINKDDITIEDLESINAEDSATKQSVDFLSRMLSFMPPSVSLVKEELTGAIEYFQSQIDYHLNIDFDGRTIIGDDPDNFSDTTYGNANVIGPSKKDVEHGTHVAGIIAAKRNNGIGINGVANNVKIMVLRSVPDGDEYDKDIALSIRYAVDNGAKVINTSFGKQFSPHADRVKEAILYASKNDVLIVNAAGNETNNVDKMPNFPTDFYNNEEIVNNFINTGAIAPMFDNNLIASFSNYGERSVDVFAPGVEIWSTTPNNNYEHLDGTSMASPEVAGVATLIRSLYPNLKAYQVKQIIVTSGLTVNHKVLIGNEKKEVLLADISKYGKIVNAYNAILMADKVNAKKLKF